VRGGGGQWPQGHTCTWRLFEAATVGRVWRATAGERKQRQLGMGWDGQKTGGRRRWRCHCTRAVRRVAVAGAARPGRAAMRAQRMHAAPEQARGWPRRWRWQWASETIVLVRHGR